MKLFMGIAIGLIIGLIITLPWYLVALDIIGLNIALGWYMGFVIGAILSQLPKDMW